MTITWGEVKFTSPVKATKWTPPKKAALYAIQYQKDPESKPDTFTLIYIGESGNLSERGFWKNHHKYDCFMKYAREESNLYISIFAMPGSREEDRKNKEQEVLSHYSNLKCQD